MKKKKGLYFWFGNQKQSDMEKKYPESSVRVGEEYVITARS